MAKQLKLENLTFYDWSVSRWVTSDAHDELDATGRGIYREMLDYCYVQGSVSGDPVVLARRCACTREELKERWETLERYFYRTADGKLRNRHADRFREEYSEFLDSQRANGKRGGRPSKTHPETDHKPTANPPVSDGKPTGLQNKTHRVTHPETHTETHPKPYTTLNNTKRNDTTPERDAAAAAFHGWFASYPKPVRKSKAEQAWFHLIDSGEITIANVPDVIAGTERWRTSKEWAKDDGEYIPDPSSFLTGNEKHSGRLWKEFPPQLAGGKKKASSDGVDPNAEWEDPEHWSKYEQN